MSPKEMVAAEILSSAADQTAAGDALRLLWTGSVGASDGPGQQVLNRAVARVLRKLLHELRSKSGDPIMAPGVLHLAQRVCQLARTQRTLRLNWPASYCEAQDQWEEILLTVPRWALTPELRREASVARLMREEASILTGVDGLDLVRPAHRGGWILRYNEKYQSVYLRAGHVSPHRLTVTARHHI